MNQNAKSPPPRDFSVPPQDGTPPKADSTTRAAIQIWTGRAINAQIYSSSLGEAYRQWLFHRANKQPRLRDIYLDGSNSFTDTMLNLKVGKEYIVVSQSDSYVRNLGRDLRGSLSSELKFATANSLREVFDDCLARKQPAYARYISSLSDRNLYWETLILPLSAHERSEPIFTMSYISILNEKTDLLQILYDRSPVGIIAAVPIMDGQNKTDDARILTLNDKAREILKQDPARGQLHSIGEMMLYLRDVLKWSSIGSSSENRTTRVEYRDPAGDEYSMTIEIINQFVLITLAGRVPPDELVPVGRFARLLGLN